MTLPVRCVIMFHYAAGEVKNPMDIILIMCVGILAGRLLRKKPIKKINEKLQLACTLLLIFSMGVMLGWRETFWQDLSSLGITSFLFFLIPTALSIAFVYYLTKRFMKQEKRTESREAG